MNLSILKNLKLELKELKPLKAIDISNNIFKILKTDDYEIRHSNLLKWLFIGSAEKPNAFNRGLLLNYLSRYIKDGALLEAIAKEEYSIKREDNNIDLLIEFDSLVVAIENKIYSKESESQLEKYYNFLSNYSNESGKKALYIFLTLSGDIPIKLEDKKKWNVSTYKELLIDLKKTFKEMKAHIRFTEEENLIIKNYIELLEEKAMGKKTEYLKEALKIYNDNIEIFEDVFKYRPDYEARASLVRDTIIQLENGFSIKGSTISYVELVNENLKTFFKNIGLNENFIYAQVDIKPHTNFPKTSIVTYCIQKETDIENNFLFDFNKAFGHTKSSRLSEGTLSRKILLNESEDMLTELEKQEKIKVNLIEYLNNDYKNIVDYVLDYKFI